MPPLNLFLIVKHQGFRESARNYLLSCCKFRSVKAAASYNEDMFLTAECYPDLLLIDSEIFFEKPGFIKEIEKLKHSKPALEVLVLFLFREDYMNCFQLISPTVSGIILKESFAEGLFKYLSIGKKSCRYSGQFLQGGDSLI